MFPWRLDAETDTIIQPPRVLLFNESVFFPAGLYGPADPPGSRSRRWEFWFPGTLMQGKDDVMTASNSFSNHQSPDLSEFDDDYDAAKPADNSEVPDGKYQARVQNVKLDYTKNKKRILRWDLVVIAGKHAHRHIFKNAVITDASLPFIKGDLKTLGLTLKKFSQLPNHMDKIVGRALEITKRTKDKYTNVYFNKLIPASGGMPSRSDEKPC